MKERFAATFKSLEALEDFYKDENPEQRAKDRVKEKKEQKTLNLLDDSKLTDIRAKQKHDDSYMGLFLPGSPKSLKIAQRMSEFDKWSSGKSSCKNKKARKIR